jgi:hypothetical protein
MAVTVTVSQDTMILPGVKHMQKKVFSSGHAKLCHGKVLCYFHPKKKISVDGLRRKICPFQKRHACESWALPLHDHLVLSRFAHLLSSMPSIQ